MNKIKIIWFIFNIAILIYFSYIHVTIHYDAVIPFFYLMLLMTFPTGFIVPYISYLLSFILPFIGVESPYMVIYDIVIPWLFFVPIGYIQWFILLPKIRKYLKSKKTVDKN